MGKKIMNSILDILSWQCPLFGYQRGEAKLAWSLEFGRDVWAGLANVGVLSTEPRATEAWRANSPISQDADLLQHS
jgi:hypothetical protein